MIQKQCIIIIIVASLIYVTQTANQTIGSSQHKNNIEVPDSSVLLLDRINLRKLSTIKYSSKQNQSTSTTENPEDEDSSRRCTCSLGVCKCCTGPLLDLINQKACMRVTYHPGDFAFDVAMSINNRVLYENSLSGQSIPFLCTLLQVWRTQQKPQIPIVVIFGQSCSLLRCKLQVCGKNPRPICVSPPRLSDLKLCAKFYNVFFPGRNFHFCLAMNGKWRNFDLYNFAFDCLRMGANGITMVGPEENGGLPIPNPQGAVDAVVDSGDDIEDYDENIVKSLLDVFD